MTTLIKDRVLDGALRSSQTLQANWKQVADVKANDPQLFECTISNQLAGGKSAQKQIKSFTYSSIHPLHTFAFSSSRSELSQHAWGEKERNTLFQVFSSSDLSVFELWEQNKHLEETHTDTSGQCWGVTEY